jgi:N-acetylglucosamine kinase-like BadF-type ATPase
MAAVYASINNPKEKAIVCILGTGSNCSYYNGVTIEQRVASLGFSIMDDASGNYFGKQLLRDFYFNKMPLEIRDDFESQYDLSADTIKLHLYKKAFPNAYLANFARFMTRHENTDYVKSILKSGVTLFVENMMAIYKNEMRDVPVHFVGSIAQFCKPQIIEAGLYYNFKVGNFEPQPIEGLVKFHKMYLL